MTIYVVTFEIYCKENSTSKTGVLGVFKSIESARKATGAFLAKCNWLSQNCYTEITEGKLEEC